MRHGAAGPWGGGAAAWALCVLALAGCGPRERGFDAARAFAHLERQVAMGPRIPGSEGHRATLEYLQAELAGRADRVSLHRFRTLSPLDSTAMDLTNVIAVFNPDSPVRLCFGAHWDTRPVADQEEDEALRSRPVPGANDGGSGVAVLLELAEQLRAVPPAIGVDLLFLDGEDSGRVTEAETFALGSQRFVADYPMYRPRLVVILDMVGRRGTRIPKEGNSVAAAPAAVENLWALGRELGLTVLADSVGKPMYDDHIPFLQAGIPAVDLIDPDDPNWHTTRDLPGACAPEPLEEVGRLSLALIRQMEQAQRP